MADLKKIQFTLNGRRCEVETTPDRILLDLLREDLGFTGTKKGCEQGECGACTVIMNGKAVLACLIPAAKADGAAITTVEGLAQEGQLHPLQEAFLSEGAVQCGYCTPGMLLSAKALLDADPTPTAGQVREAISGNLCRCTGYTKIIRAIQAATPSLPSPVKGEGYAGLAVTPTPPTPVKGKGYAGLAVIPTPPSTVEGEGYAGLAATAIRTTTPFKGEGDREDATSPPAPLAGEGQRVGGTQESVIGRSLARVDGRDKLTGNARYAGDVSLPGMLHLKIVRSDRPHAKISAIQTEDAQHHPGVVAVFTHQDIPGVNRLRHGQQVLCDERVRCIGDPVVMVAAETLSAALAAATLVRVVYEDLPGVFSPEEALKPDAVPIHDGGNLLLERTLRKGDPEQGLRDAAVVITNTYRTQMVEHAYLEPEAAVAACDAGKVTVWMPSKYAHSDRKEIAALLGLKQNKLRIINATIGGSFGDKASLSPGYYAALASLKTGRPAKLVYTREESFFASKKRHPFVIDYTTGATRAGRIRAVKVEITADAGAYAASTSSVLLKSLIHAAGPYEIPHVLVKVRGVYTNNPVASAMRGLGVPQMAFAHESQMDMLAERVGKDPFAIRSMNGLKPGSLTATGQELGASVGLAATLQKVKDEITRRGTPKASGSKRYGWGMASMFYGIGSAGKDNPGTARIEADDTGGFQVYVGCGDVGQGSSTVLTQIAAQVLECRTDAIRLIADDTDCCPDSGSTVASRITYLVGNAVRIAAEKLKDLLQDAAASILEIDAETLSLENGIFSSPGNPRRTVSVAQAVAKLRAQRIAPEAEGEFGADVTALDPQTTQGSPMATYAFATQGALVSLDAASGEAEVLSVIACHDVGKAINPAGVTGQIEGAIAMGLGFSLMEEVLLEKGLIRNPGFRSYFLPTSLDMAEATVLLVEETEPSGPFGAKGIAEPALIATAPAIINALNAAAGRQAKKLPLTSEALWRLLHPCPVQQIPPGAGD